MKKLTLILSALFVSISMFGQKLDVGINSMNGMPLGNYNFGDADGTISLPPGMGIGGGVEANYWFTTKLSAGLEVGFLNFAAESKIVEGILYSSEATAIPIVAKGTFYMSEGKFKPLVGLGIGYTIYTPKNGAVVPLTVPVVVENTWNQSGLSVSPRLGFVAILTDLVALNFNVQYNLMLNNVDGDIEMTSTIDGESMTGTATGAKIDATNYLGLNVGVLFTIFDDSGLF